MGSFYDRERGKGMTNSKLRGLDLDFPPYYNTKENVEASECANNVIIVEKPKKPTIIFVGEDKKINDNIVARGTGFFDCENIMPNILNVRVEESTSNKNKESKTQIVFVDFTDGTSEKAVLHPDDIFSLEQGISICITKKLLSMKTNGYGHSAYNKIINRGVAVYKRSVEVAKKAAEDKEAEEKRLTNAKAKLARKRAKKAAKKREYEIELRKEAYVRAIQELASNGEDSASY